MVLAIAAVGRGVGRACVDIIASPWWWYAYGLPRVVSWAWRGCRGWEETIGWRVWARNLFAPMFGQADLSGRVISFGMRCVVLLARTVAVGGAAVVALVVLLAYVFLPVIGVGILLAARWTA